MIFALNMLIMFIAFGILTFYPSSKGWLIGLLTALSFQLGRWAQRREHARAYDQAWKNLGHK